MNIKSMKFSLFYTMLLCLNLLNTGCEKSAATNGKKEIVEDERTAKAMENYKKENVHTSQPNVLIVFGDQLSQQVLRINGAVNAANTPNIDSLAQSGVRFMRSYCSTPQCSPSRSSLLTGLLPNKTGILTNVGSLGVGNMDTGFTTIGSYLQAKGYTTAYVGKWHLSLNKGGTAIRDYGFDYVAEPKGGDNGKTSEIVKFLGTQTKEKPWFAMVSYNQPHDICNVKSRLKIIPKLNIEDITLPGNLEDDLDDKPIAQSIFRDDMIRRHFSNGADDVGWKYYLSYYKYLAKDLDCQVGTIIEKLKEMGQYENTLIIFTSDHGDLMAEHGMAVKGPAMYEPVVKVPLIYRWPGVIPENETREHLTLNTDVFPTICDLLGYTIPEGIYGVSIKDSIINPKANGRDRVILEYFSKGKTIDAIRTMITDNFKYNYYLTGEEEFYDLKEDALEMHNLANDTNYATQKEKIKNELLEHIEKSEDKFFEYKNIDISQLASDGSSDDE